MIKSNLTLSEAIVQFDRSPTSSAAVGYRSQLAEILKRFPRDEWPAMSLGDYALGQPGVEDTYCYWLEYKSQLVGSIRGGSARKLIIYKRRDREGWYFPTVFSDEGEAWDRLRSEFVEAFGLAERGDWERIDELETLGLGPAVKLKSLHVYFPDEVLPVCSTAHLRHFLRSLERPSEEVDASSVVALNRFLLAALRGNAALEGWNTEELQRLLYIWRDPRPTKRVLKIAPGENAKFWDDCLREGYICVAWDEVGDLSQFESREAFRARFEEAFPYNGHLPQARRKGNELWALTELEPGDLVVANRGISQVLAVGEVVEPGYRWADERSEYRHTVAVNWDTSYEQRLTPQKSWGTVTVAKVADTLLKKIVRGKGPEPVVVDAVYGRIAAALERKGQLILYGPPGTGKTYQARRFAVWWLLKQIGRKGADAVLGASDRLHDAERELSHADSGPRASVGLLTRVTFHPSYTYEDFIEGFRPDASGAGGLSLALEDGVFKRVCRAAQANPGRPYLLLIDEINRGNVAKIMGELLTLLEQDKRGLSVTLPQSKETFSVPANVFLLGTMNTADRSIKLLDAALRRRFAFIECMPDTELLHGAAVGELALDDFLDGLNQRIARFEGREKQVGHSYLLVDGQPVDEVDEFAARFREEILPLLQEYCYDDYAMLAKFIGSELVDADAGTLDAEKVDDAEQLVAALAREFDEGGVSSG